MQFEIKTDAQFVVKCFDCGSIQFFNLSSFFGEVSEDLVRCRECEAPLFYFDEYGVIDSPGDRDDCLPILEMQSAQERFKSGTDKFADEWKEIEAEKEDRFLDDED